VQAIGVAVAEVERVIIRLFWVSALLAGNTVDHVVVAFIESLFRIVQGLSFLRDMEIRLLSVIEDLLGKASNDDEGRNGSGLGDLGAQSAMKVELSSWPPSIRVVARNGTSAGGRWCFSAKVFAKARAWVSRVRISSVLRAHIWLSAQPTNK
jgi:hypothetical protein